MRLERSAYAIEDRLAIFDYIEADNPRAAATVDDHIRLQVERLIHHPESGRVGRVEGTRELVIDRIPYIAAYRVVGETVRILAASLRHGRPALSLARQATSSA